MNLTEQQKKVIESIYAAGYERGVQDLDNELDYDPAARGLEFLAEIDADGGLDSLFGSAARVARIIRCRKIGRRGSD